MADIVNELGQPIGWPVATDLPRPRPEKVRLEGRFCSLVPLDVEAHGGQLWEAFSADMTGVDWTYLPVAPIETEADFGVFLRAAEASEDPLYFTVLNAEGRAVGHATYLRIDPANGVIEVGYIHFSPLMQRTPMSTEAMYLMMAYVFETLGYRRYEWKCDALNAPSLAAAKRLGFTFEGVFRQAVVYKGRNRDTAWLSVLDSEWPALKARFERWLDVENFDSKGRQRTRL
ncbi:MULTISPECIES: GNAT family N-acetyltransferase [Lentibacter]|uniref:Protein N-acetyltransferase, RimJ/RimL family n=1 Tax=Lentibacter algarum TaxID=576131 RepID=A0A1H3GUA9_9RHOB|nr:GNAT family protein [Lentibacter algarum]MCO4777242.1 GNAT family N-acetyltransferase [Lentibacter algarum]WIF30526.1 acetyltransferase domain-containing protein [Lentibacter algarum]SDY06912.1 Protein N-acetyltransferase, RimJ/RimL family [Lentibacter algarum]